MKILGIIILVMIGGYVLFQFFRPNRASQPPLDISDDDPDMKNAMAAAKSSIAEFISLYAKYPEGAMIKVPFVTSIGKKEYLAADVLEIKGTQINVRLATPPVTHTGEVDRLRTYEINELVDWIIVLPGDKREGGFTMKVMFQKARQQWGELPLELANEEAKYNK